MNNDQISSSHGENYAKHANGDTAKEVVFDETQTEPQHQAPADNAAHANGGPPPIRPPFYRRLTAWWDDPFRPKANFAEKLTVFITLVIAGIGATQACIYRGQLQVMSGQLRQMRQSSADATNQVWQAVGNINWMARSMDWSQKEAQRSIELSEQESRTALNASIANSRLEQRPWLGAATDIGVMDSDKPLPDAMNFGVINYGKTFAKKVTLSQHSTFSATLFTVLPATHETTEKSVAVLAPKCPIYHAHWPSGPYVQTERYLPLLRYNQRLVFLPLGRNYLPGCLSSARNSPHSILLLSENLCIWRPHPMRNA